MKYLAELIDVEDAVLLGKVALLLFLALIGLFVIAAGLGMAVAIFDLARGAG